MLKKSFLTIILFMTIIISGFASDFIFGADISWTTQMEKEGHKLFNYVGEEREGTALMKEMGLNAIRLRVWVNPSEHGGWCDKNDVLVKALRAKELGMDIMIDFHYSDYWADPAHQNIPEAWNKHKYKTLLTDVASHTSEVLQLLKDNNVEVKWVQVGNEISNGFLWPIGRLEDNPKQYAGLFAAGYNAVKAIMPDTKVIVHLDNGYDNDLYNYNLDALRDNGAKWDIIGMSLYPYWAKDKGYSNSAMRLFQECVRNIHALVKKFQTDVMIVETGFEVNEQEPWVMESGRTQLSEFIHLLRGKTGGHCLGIFYWEPTCKPSQYKLGAFTEDGKPTSIMRAFTSNTGTLPVAYDRPLVRLSTSLGDIIIELYNETPHHRDNFIALVKSGKLNNTLFHRVINNFIIQGGDPSSATVASTSIDNPVLTGINNVTDANDNEYLISPEFTIPQHFHKRGALSAARADDSKNPELRSSSSQFFITWGKWPTARKAESDVSPLPYYLENQQAGVPYLDGAYTVFGEVFSGLDVVEKIQRLQTDCNNRPLQDVRVTFELIR